ncbi:MAG: ABC transporter ATP-binding protein [Desulfurococcales archaeon]|nr:ABC transporter ATP-binding protein [Desulfurococcales archaeon]MEB3789096.1 ABC transporter ATP-binding protein [Desulfurococcales archaeon]
MAEGDIVILRVEKVTKRFGGLVALSDVSFEVNQGEILGLIGPNGAGKTTLFNVITGVYKPEEGRVIFKNKDITGLRPHKIARMGIARTHQIVKPFGDLTVLENTMIGALYGRRHGHITEEEARDIALDILEFVGLKEKADLPARILNIQEKKRLELARALAEEPELLLLDEVLAGLNPSEVAKMLDLLRKIRSEKNVTMIMIEHVMHAVMNLADRIVVLHFGRKIAEGTPEEVASNPEVITAYLGDPEMALKFVKSLKKG